METDTIQFNLPVKRVDDSELDKNMEKDHRKYAGENEVAEIKWIASDKPCSINMQVVHDGLQTLIPS